MRVEMEGFGPFKSRQEVDFTAFADDGIFLIGGRTGAGKTSILDAICFALYGRAPRYDGASPRLRSDHCLPDDPTSVVLEFEAGAEVYRLTRSPEYERPARRGGGLTTQAPTAVLEVRRGDEWEGLAAKPRDVGIAVDDIVQLSREQFQQVILLAQNRFHEFLLADSDNRQRLLRTLFGTERFEDYDRRLQERRKALDDELGRARVGLHALVEQVAQLIEQPHPESDAGLAEWAASGAALAESAADAAEAARDAAQTAERAAAERRDAARVLAERQKRLASGRERLIALEQRESEVAPYADLIDGAERAERLTETGRRRERARRRLDEARASVDAARDAAGELPDLRADADAAPTAGAPAAATSASVEDRRAAIETAAVAALIDRSTRELGGLESAARLETELPTRDRAATAAQAALAQHDVDATELDAELTTLLTRRERLVADLDTATAGAAPLEAAATERAALREARDAARAAAALEPELTSAETAALAAAEQRTAAAGAATELRRRRLLGQAAHLAGELNAGEPCPVCGAVEHPAPASWDDDPVDDDDVTVAEERAEAAAGALRRADDAVAALRQRIAAQRGAAGERGVDELETAERGAAERVHAAETARAEQTRLVDERTSSEQREQSIRSRQQTRSTERAELATEQTRTQEAAQSARDEVAAARGEHATVAARVAELTATRRTAEALRDALAEQGTATEASIGAEEDWVAQRATQGFADDEAVTAAALPASEVGRMRSTVDAVALGLAEVRGLLGADDLQSVPDDPADVDSAAEAHATAGAAARDALVRASTLRDAATRTARLAGQVRATTDELGDLVERADTVRRLADTVHGRSPNEYGMRLESYVLAAELEEIVAAANERLRSMTAGRYLLEHSDQRLRKNAQGGLDLSVIDQHTGVPRPPRSLSGGETFLASLALALGLSEVVTARAGGIRLDTLFIDEGFGSLDGDTLEIAMSTLDGLRQGGRTIGLISHVEAMKEEIPSRVSVDISAQGWSEIRVGEVA
nr:SMC family ATPase [Schumannella luteola]